MARRSRPGILGWALRYYGIVGLAALPACFIGSVFVFRHFAAMVPKVEAVDAFASEAPGVTRISGSHGELLSELAREHRQYASLDQIPESLILAFLAAEDRRFFEHAGVDVRGLVRALVANWRQGTVVQGGSTITQQVAKSFLENRARTIERKGIEAILALRIESALGKAKILEIYLNKIFLGSGSYGVAAAASRYFDKELAELTLAESAMIAGLARAPSRFSPRSSIERATNRRNVVLQAMAESGAIDQSAADLAKQDPILLSEQPDVFRDRAPYYAEAVRQQAVARFGDEPVLQDGLHIESALDAMVQAAARDAADKAARSLDRRHGWRGPVAHLARDNQREVFLDRIKSRDAGGPMHFPERWYLALVGSVGSSSATVQVGNLEAELPLRYAGWARPYDASSGINEGAINSFRGVLEPGDVVWVKQQASRSKDEHLVVQLGQTPMIEAAMYAIDPKTGYVPTIVGGIEYDRSQFNRATQACRQPGSVFKAVYYALALNSGQWQMDSILEAKPWVPEPGEVWNPRNIDKTVDGKVLLRTALIRSLNTPSIRLFVSLGAPQVVAWARKLGITTDLIADKGLSLGASCVLNAEITGVFATYARGGTPTKQVLIRRVEDKNNLVRLDDRHPSDPRMDALGRANAIFQRAIAPDQQLIDERTNFLISRLLREVVTAGIGSRASTIGVPAAGKSGSASGRFRRGNRVQDLTTDTWFIGYTSKLVASAWMGFDNVQERSLGDEEASYTTATPMWTDFMGDIVEGHESEYEQIPVRRPAGLTVRTADAMTGGEPVAGQLQAQIYSRKE